MSVILLDASSLVSLSPLLSKSVVPNLNMALSDCKSRLVMVEQQTRCDGVKDQSDQTVCGMMHQKSELLWSNSDEVKSMPLHRL